MTVQTRSKFYYGIEVTTANNSINFDESSGELLAELNVGTYSLTDLTTEIARAMNQAGTLDYTVTVNRTTRIITIAATGTFDLLFSSGTNVTTSAGPLIGFDAVDVTGAATYDGNNGAGSEFIPQFYLQNYVPFENFKEFVFGKVNESASGQVETVSFGTKRFLQCNITLITDLPQGDTGPIENNASAVSQVLDFLDFVTNKGDVEFMPDRDTPATFTKCVLESTPISSDGIGYRLTELTNINIAGYYETGLLTFREITS